MSKNYLTKTVATKRILEKKMGVLIIGQTKTRWQNGILIHEEAIRQNKNVGFISSKGEKEFSKKMIYGEFDWVFVVGAGSLSVEFFKEIANVKKLLIWDADGLTFGRKEKWDELKGVPDIIISSVLGVVNRLKGYAKQMVVWRPQYYDNVYYALNLKEMGEKEYDVCFIGSCNGDNKRIEWLDELNKIFNIKIVGGHPNFGSDRYFGYKMANLYYRSKIAIDISRSWRVEEDFQVSDRLYKAMGCGCFYLTYPIGKLEPLFIKGEHLDCYDGTFESLINKIKYYLKMEKLRKKIAKAGQEEILKRHTLRIRLGEYWKLMESV